VLEPEIKVIVPKVPKEPKKSKAKVGVGVLTLENVRAWASENIREKLGFEANTVDTIETEKIDTAKIVPLEVTAPAPPNTKSKSNNMNITFEFLNRLGNSFDTTMSWDKLNTEVGLKGKGKNFAKTFFNNPLTLIGLAKLHAVEIVLLEGGVKFSYNTAKSVEQMSDEYVTKFDRYQDLIVSRLVDRQGKGTSIPNDLEFDNLDAESKTAICSALFKKMKECFKERRIIHNPTFCIKENENIIYFSSIEIENGKLSNLSDLSSELERDAELLKSMR